MNNVIKCKKCGAEIEVSEALTHQIEEQVLLTLEIKHKKELEDTKLAAEEVAKKKVGKEFEQSLETLKKENTEEKDRNKSLTEKLDKLLEEMRALRRKDEERELEMKQKIMDEEEKIRKEVRKQSEDEHQFKDLEKDKKLTDTLKQLEELKTKMEQGSQQTQGEVMELELERILKSEFPQDNILEVKKGERGADIVHEVTDKLGRSCGTILWESKNAQWQNGWIAKLKEDQRAKKSDLAILVTINKPEFLDSFTYKDGVWITTWKFVVPLALSLRYNLVSLNHERSNGEGKNEKMEVLYKYLTGTEFKHRVEAVVEGFGNLQDELEREKRWFNSKWARQEKEIRKVLDSTHGMYGDLQGIIGKSLPEIKTLELEPPL